jgi:hypothetical protein
MKKIFLILSSFVIVSVTANAQLNALLNQVTGSKGTGLSNDDIVAGLKAALNKGVDSGTHKLSAVDGFFKDAAVKILMPPEAKKVESSLRSIGLGKEVDDAILSMNRAAEDAAKSAAPIFVDAIKGMSITDALNILKGTDTAATGYLRSKTTASLTTAFKPVIDKSLAKVDATKYWNDIITTYNKMPFVSRINPDLSAYVTEKALNAVFIKIAEQEKEIRKDPLARTSDILQKVFGSK